MESNTSTQSIPPTVPQNPIQPPIPEKHKTPIFLWFLILALVGIATYFGYQNWLLRQQVSRPQPTSSSLIATTPTPDPTVNWKTYTNSKFNYSVKYPNSGVARINCENEENTFYLVLGSQQDMIEPQNCARDSRFNIEIVASNKLLKNADDRYQSTSNDYQIAGMKAFKYVYTQKPNFEGPGESWFEDVYFENDGIFYDAYNRNKELSATFDQILSTFIFVDQAVKEEKRLAYIKSIVPVYDSYQLVVLYANWIEDKTQPNGYRIEQRSTELVTLPLELNPVITMQKMSHADVNKNFDTPITLSEFISLHESNTPIKNALYWLEMKNGTVTKITEQYQP